ncbi:MAG: helix-turn-helix domain-containing protein [Pseudohaliea sp.]
MLWLEGLPPDAWARHVADIVGSGPAEARALLESRIASLATLKRLEARFGVAGEELLYADLLAESGKNVLRENLRYLLQERGSKKRMADALDLNVNTVSKWMSGRSTPQASNLQAILRYFDFPTWTDLTKEPVFLSLEPTSVQQQRAWLIERVHAVDVRVIRRHFASLHKILIDGDA